MGGRTRGRSGWRRWGRPLALVPMMLALLLLLLVAFPQPRGALLASLLGRGLGALPGEATFEEFGWSRPGSIRMGGFRWTEGSRQLVALESLDIRWSPRALLRRDLEIAELRLRGLEWDRPAVDSLLAAARPAPGRLPWLREGSLAGLPWLREGSLAGLPSLALRELDLRGAAIILEPGAEPAGLELAASLDLLSGGSPALALERLDLAVPQGITIRSSGLRFDPAQWMAEGDGEVLLPDGSALALHIGPGAGELRLEADFSDPGGRVSPGLLDLELAWRRDGRLPGGLDCRGRLELPESLLPDVATLARWGMSVPARLFLDLGGGIAWSPRPGARLAFGAVPRDELAGLSGFLEWEPGLVVLDSLRAEIRPASPRLDSLLLRGRARWDGLWTGAFALAAASGERRLAASCLARYDAGGLDLRLPPLYYREDGGPLAADPPDAAAEVAGRLIWDRASGRLELEGLEISGLAEELCLAGQRSGNGRIRASLRLSAPSEAPALLAACLPSAPLISGWESRWSDSGGLDLELDLTAGPEGLRARGAFSAPGPLCWLSPTEYAAALPGAGPLSGRFRLDAPGLAPAGLVLDLDFQGLGWLAPSRLILGEDAGAWRLDSLGLGLPGLDLILRGRFFADSLRLDGRWRLDLERLAEGRPALSALPAGLIEGGLDLSRAGPSRRAVLRGEGRLLHPAFATESLALEAVFEGDSLSGSLRAAAGTRLSTAVLDLVELRFAGALPLLTAELSMEVRAPGLMLRQEGRIRRSGNWLLEGRSLEFTLRDRSLRNTGPYLVGWEPAAGHLSLGSVDLRGDMGWLQVEGSLEPGLLKLGGELSLLLPPQPVGFELPPALWPRQFDLELSGTLPGVLIASASATGLELEPGRPLILALEAELRDSLAAAAWDLRDSSRRLLHGNLSLPASVCLDPAALRLLPGPAKLTLQADSLRFDSSRLGLGARHQLWLLDGRISGSGEAERFSALGDLSLRLDDPSPVGRLRLRAAVALVPPGGLPESMAPAPGSLLKAAAIGRDPGLYAGLALERGERDLLTGDLRLPGMPAPGFRGWTEGSPPGLVASMSADPMPWSEIDAFLPPGFGLGGSGSFSLSANGDPVAPDLGGSLMLKPLRVGLAGGSNFDLDGTLELEGTARRPRLRGRLELRRGRLRIPDPPRNLLSAEGEALLWSAYGLEPEEAPARPSSIPAFSANLDAELSLNIPGGLWVSGRGMDIELGGELQLSYQDSVPVLVGELNALRGTLALLGRNFRVESGKAVFYGDPGLNPSLDIQLLAHVEGTLVRVKLGGKLSDPTVDFESEPEMSEADILSFLLFGRRLGDLNDDQFALVQSRAADLAAAYGSARLEARLSRQLGVDLLRLRKSGDSGLTLSLGKYLSRRTLLRYEQPLEGKGTSVLSLEYYLARQVKLEGSVDQFQRSSIELNWNRDY